MPTRESTDAYYKKYHASPKAKKQRAARNRARREAEKEGKVHKGDGKEVDHKRALSNGGSTGKSNTRVISRKQNRSYKRDRNNKPIGRA
jgi:hypothetical protein